MLKTEDQARETHCPIIRPPGPCLASRCMGWRYAPMQPVMILRRIHKGTAEWEAYRSACKMRGNYFELDGAWWRYQHTSSDSKGEYDLIIRSPDEGEDVPTMGGYCGLAGPPEE